MATDLRPFTLLLRCTLCEAPPFETGCGPDGQADMDRHLKAAHGLTFDPPTLEAWLERVRRG